MPFELEGSAEHSDLRHGFGGLTCGAEEMERRVRAAHAFSARRRAEQLGEGGGGDDGGDDSDDGLDELVGALGP